MRRPPRPTSSPRSSSRTPTSPGCSRPGTRPRRPDRPRCRGSRWSSSTRTRPAAPREANPLPVLTAPVACAAPARERWAWAHVEARLHDAVTDREAARRMAEAGVRTHSADVVARLLCPRRLRENRGWIAAVVPVTNAGVAAGLRRSVVGAPGADAWVGDAGTVDLPVYHWWRFRTMADGSFEELARRLRHRDATAAGLGSRRIDVGDPWHSAQPGTATVALDGALRPPGTGATTETWSDRAAQEAFTGQLRERLDAPARNRDLPDDDLPADRDTTAVGPPLLRQPLHRRTDGAGGARSRSGELADHPQPGGTPPGCRRPRRALRAARAGVPDGPRLGAGRRDPGGQPADGGRRAGGRGRRAAPSASTSTAAGGGPLLTDGRASAATGSRWPRTDASTRTLASTLSDTSVLPGATSTAFARLTRRAGRPGAPRRPGRRSTPTR